METERVLFGCSCEGMDSVSISILIDNMPHNLGVYCGSKQPPILMSNNNHMEVIFTALAGSSDATGFTATYNFVTGELDITRAAEYSSWSLTQVSHALLYLLYSGPWFNIKM